MRALISGVQRDLAEAARTCRQGSAGFALAGQGQEWIGGGPAELSGGGVVGLGGGGNPEFGFGAQFVLHAAAALTPRHIEVEGVNHLGELVMLVPECQSIVEH
jgi:hypothetical protein